MKCYVFRLKPGQDLKKEIELLTKKNNIKAGFILTCVGSLNNACLRLADESVKDFNKKFEIVSLVGTLSQKNVHLHLSVSDSKGKTIGGHLKEGCIVNTTAEIVVGCLENCLFSRKFDINTGFKELKINRL